jgi:site-specific DNA recombinase
MSTTPRRAAVYLRVSLDATGEGLAVDRQREACLSIVAARGWQLVEEYVDNSISATDAKKNRPGYNRLVEDLQAGRFDALVCYDLDRLTRQPRQLEDWIDAADRDALALVTANGEADLTTDAGRLFARIKLAVARSEVERKSVRQRDAAKQRSELGRPPLGVRLTGYTPQGDLVPDEAEVVRQMFDRFAAGEPLRAIARTLTEAGVTTRRGRPWHPSTIRTILTNPRYAGRAVYQGQETGKPGGWVPIVDDAQYDAVQALLRDHGRRTQTTTERKHLGSGLYLCAECEEPVSAWSGNRYRCRVGAHVNRAQGPVDGYVEAIVVERLRRADLASVLVDHDVDTTPYLAEIERQKRLLRRAEDDYKAELIDGPLYKVTRDDASRALREAEDALAALSRPSAAAAVIGAPDPAAAYGDADLMTRRAVLDLLLVVRLLPGHRYSRTFDPETVLVEWKR